MRQFPIICPDTEEQCYRPDCKKDLCAVQHESAMPRIPYYWGEFSKAEIDREMKDEAEATIRQKYGKGIARKTLDERCNKLLADNHAEFAAMARETLRSRKKRGPLALKAILTLAAARRRV